MGAIHPMRTKPACLYLSLLLSLFIQLPALAQTTLTGTLTDAQTGEAIAFANIGIPGTGAGTLSNPDGSYELHIPAAQSGQPIHYSALGYQPLTLPVQQAGTVRLQPRPIMLDPVILTAKREKHKTQEFGNGKSLLLYGHLFLDTLTAGSAMALLIDKREVPDLTFVESVSLHIARNKFPTFKVRLRFLAVDSTNHNKPGQDLTQEQIIATSSISKGWLDFPIPPALRITNQAFYLVCEWILDAQDRKEVSRAYDAYMAEFPAQVSYDTVLVAGEKVVIPMVPKMVAGTVFGSSKSAKDLREQQCYYRNHSFGDWKRSSGILSAKITMSNQPTAAQEGQQKSATAPDSDRDSKIPCLQDPTSCSVADWAEALRQQKQLPGLQIALWQDGQWRINQGFGQQNTETGEAMTESTQLRIASLSKTMTATALFQLLHDKGISPDTTIQRFLPDFHPEAPMTLRQIANHRAGIRHYHSKSLDEIFVQKHYNSATDALSRFADDPLIAAPGERFHYSSFGYTLLGALIESLSAKDYLPYMQENLWQPLQMQSTYGEIADSLMPAKSHFYLPDGTEAPAYDPSYSHPTGGLLSTAADLVRFGKTVAFDDAFISPALRKSLFTEETKTKKTGTAYNLGWYLHSDATLGPVTYHTGELPTTASLLLILPDHKLVLAIISNGPDAHSPEPSILTHSHRLLQALTDK